MELNRESIYRLSNIEDIKKFLIGGNAIITLESKQTSRWFTYRIKAKDKDDELSPYFVSVLTGMDNESAYTYIGAIFNHNSFKLTKNSKIGDTAPSYIAFNYFFANLMNNRLHPDLAVYHRGICGRCGRTITVPESLITGLGPECAKITKF
jgi:hypothetical protein